MIKAQEDRLDNMKRLVDMKDQKKETKEAISSYDQNLYFVFW